MIDRCRVCSVIGLALGVAMSLSPLLSQKTQTGGGPAPGPTAPTAPTAPGPSPGTTTPFPNTNNRQIPGQNDQNRFPDMTQRPLFFSGKVVLDDGTPPPD